MGGLETRDKRLHPVVEGTSARHQAAEEKVEDRGKAPDRAGNIQNVQRQMGSPFLSNETQGLTILTWRMAIKEATGQVGSSVGQVGTGEGPSCQELGRRGSLSMKVGSGVQDG